ncbi:E3 ubiquitin-protein ligase Topors-like isoform X2 [Gigantopelta aegis]|uniref:E3 ubiquitin-protein ligase Topors-like isoform X2 n=1 Tax=Gigantopelta aegis TaxID=1735272 RepID=UPI001B888E29|nr:E3 ubiquitin-protein ligase Topors-like isoform X2 [Gigantopelta aegis]
MAELKRSKSKLPPDRVKQNEKLKKSRKQKKGAPTSPAISETKSADASLDEVQSGPGDKKTKSKSELSEVSDDTILPDTEDNSKNTAPPSAKSPEPNCAICLSRLENKSFTDSCFHMFCFVCLQEWSKIKPECPLCKQPFKSIIHNVRSYEDYDQYHLERQERSQASWENPDGRRFRYRTTVTQEHIFNFHRYADILRRPAAVGARLQASNQVTTRQNWRRQRQVATSEFRSQIYRNGMRVKEVANTNGRQRDITPSFFSANPSSIHRLIPWLNRELNALMHNDEHHVQFLIEFITGLIKRFDVQSEEFYEHIYPFVGRHTRHFMDEFQMFARSPFSMTVYDTKAVYEQELHSVSDSDSDLSYDGNDSDVMIISPSASTGTLGAHSVVPSHSRRRQRTEPPAERRWLEMGLSPRTDNLRDLLGDNFDAAPIHSTTGQSGWESPNPGPSWSMFLPMSVSSQIDVSTTEGSQNHVNKTSRKSKRSTDKKVKLEEGPERSQVIDSGSDSDSSSSSDVIFVGYDRPWQERSPLLISTSGESDKDDKKPKIESDKNSKTKTLTAKSPRSESDERYTNASSSYSRHRLLHSASHHQKRRSRLPSPSSGEESDNDNTSPKSKTDKHPKTKTLIAKRPRSESDERYSSVSSSYSKLWLLHSTSHKKRRSRSPAYSRSKESRSSSSSKYRHKKFSRKKHKRHHKSRPSSSGDDIDCRPPKRSDSISSKSSKHSTKRDRSYHDRYVLSQSHSRSHSRSPSYSHKQDRHKIHRHRNHTSQFRSKELTTGSKENHSSGSKENHSKHKKHKKHKSDHGRCRHNKQKSRRRKDRRSKDGEECDPHLALSDFNKDDQREQETLKNMLLGEKIASKVVIPSREVECFNGSDDRMSFSAEATMFKKHPWGHKKSKTNKVGSNSYAASGTSSRNFTCIKDRHETSESDQSDHSGLDSLIQHEILENTKDHNQPQKNTQKERQDSTGAASVSSDDSGVASLLALVSRKSQKDLISFNGGENSKSTNDGRETNRIDVGEIPVSLTCVNRDSTSTDEPETVTNSTQLPSTKNTEFSDSATMNSYGFNLNGFTDAGLNPEHLFQTSSSESVVVETLTVDSSSDDSSICVTSSNFYVDRTSVPLTPPRTSFSLNMFGQQLHGTVLNSISSILPVRDEDLVLPGSTSDMPCNIESDDQIEIDSDCDEEVSAVDFSTRSSSTATDVKSKSGKTQHKILCSDSESETDTSCQSTQRGYNIPKCSNFDPDNSNDSESGQLNVGQIRRFGVLSEIGHFAVLPSTRRSTEKSDVCSEDKPLDLSAQYEVAHLQKPVENAVLNASSVKNDVFATETVLLNTLLHEGTLEEESPCPSPCDRSTVDQALDLRARKDSKKIKQQESVVNNLSKESPSTSSVVNNLDMESSTISMANNLGSESPSTSSVVNNLNMESGTISVANNLGSESPSTSSVVNNLNMEFGTISVANNLGSESPSTSSVVNNLNMESGTILMANNLGSESPSISSAVNNLNMESGTISMANNLGSESPSTSSVVNNLNMESGTILMANNLGSESPSTSSVVNNLNMESGTIAMVNNLGSESVVNKLGIGSPSTGSVMNDLNMESSTISIANNLGCESPSTSSVVNNLARESSSTISMVGNLISELPTISVVSNLISESPPTNVMEINLRCESPSTSSVVNNLNRESSSTSVLNNADAKSSSVSNASLNLFLCDDQISKKIPDSQGESMEF